MTEFQSGEEAERLDSERHVDSVSRQLHITSVACGASQTEVHIR